jgi:hypothetical protein
MPDSVSSIVGFCHSRMLALLPRVKAKLRPGQPVSFANPDRLPGAAI